MPASPAKPTISSLAKELSLSTCTVSKILNRSFDGFTYAPATIRRVEKLAARNGYVPNVHARSLRTRKSMTVGLVVPSGIPYFTGALVEEIEKQLRPFSYETIVGHSTSEAASEAKLLRAMLAKGVDGLLWIPNGKTLRPRDLEINKQFPLVLLDRPGCSNTFPTVITDNKAASEDLARRVRALGHKSVFMLTAPSDDDSIVEREEGIAAVFGSKITRLDADNTVEGASRLVEERVRKLRGGVLVCLTQNLALGAFSALAKNNLAIGSEVGFASFDALPLCEIWQPSLTRIEQNLELLAVESVRLLLEKTQNPASKQPLEVRIAAHLAWGTSVQPPR